MSEVEKFIKDNGMLFNIFLWQINNHCVDASGSYHDLRNVYTKRLDNTMFREFVWTNLDNFLSDTAMLSKILFPSTKKAFSKLRGNGLLNLLNLLPSQLPNLSKRSLRNRKEHLDEDLDKWWIEKKSNDNGRDNFAIKAIDGLDDDVIYGPNVHLAFMYNPSTGIVHHFDKDFDIHEIFEEVLLVASARKDSFERLNELAGEQIIRESR